MAKLAPPPPKKLTRRYDVRSASPTLKGLFEIMHHRGITVRQMALSLDRHENVLSSWRSGRSEPKMMDVEEMAHTLGYKLVLVQDERRDLD